MALAVAGCGGTTIDATKSSETLQASLEKSLHEKIMEVDCPSGVEVEAGQTFECTVDFSNGKQAIATLKVRDKEADVSVVGIKPSESK